MERSAFGNRSERTESPRSVREKECFDQRNVTRLGQLAEPCVAVYKMNSDAELLQVADLIGWCRAFAPSPRRHLGARRSWR